MEPSNLDVFVQLLPEVLDTSSMETVRKKASSCAAGLGNPAT